MGGFEPKAKPWTVDPIPSTFQFQLLDEDWDQFEPLDDGRDPTHAVPRDGPDQDAAQRAGELHARRQLHPRRGARAAPLLRRRRLQLGGHRQLGRRRQADRGMDRRRRAAERSRRRRHPPLRRAHREQEGARRAHRRDARPALRDALAAPGARVGAAAAHEPALRPARRAAAPASARRTAGSARTTSAPARRPRRRPTAHGSASRRGSNDMAREQRATRQAVALYDQTSFGKMLLQGRDALAVLQRLCANDMDVAPGRMVYTPMLNERGGFESDVTVTRLAADRFLVVTGSAQTPRDLDWIARHTRAGEAAALVDVTAMTSVLSLMGPNARTLLGRVGAPDTFAALGPERLRFATTTRDRPRLRARPRGAHELRRRPGLRALRADRDGAPCLTSPCTRRAKASASTAARSPTPATTRSMPCASRPAGAPGAPSSDRTRRRSRRERCSRSSPPRATTSSARRR